MAKKKKAVPLTEPTNAELEILQVLWEHGPSTVRFVNDMLNVSRRPVNYSSTLKQMQVMVEKKLLTRDESQMKHIYIPVHEEDKMKNHYVKKFIDAFYKGSPGKLILQLLGSQQASKEDIENIREQLKKLEK